MGDFTADLFRCITIINSLEDFPHIHSSILRDLRASSKDKVYTSKDIRHYLESEQTLHAATEKPHSASDIALSARTSNVKSSNIPTCSNCKRLGHSNQYCISPGGGMAGKTIQESKDTCYKDREISRGTNGTKSNNTNGKIAVNMKDSSGKAFIVYVNPNDISSPINDAKPEFAGLASDLPESLLPDTIEDIEWCGWLAFEEELTTSLDWMTHTKPVDIAAISEVSPLQQNKRTPISLDDLPFYVDTGATVHISPEKSDFLTLRPIAARSVKGVGGSSITAVGLGDIKLRIARGAHIILQNVLFIPNATVRLILVSTLAHDSQAVAHFDATTCWIMSKSTGAIIARGPLLPKKNLYSLNLLSPHAEHAFTLSHAPDLGTWHRCLGHANYHAVKEMAKSGLIPGMPTNFLPGNPPKCEFCVLGKQTKTPVPKTRQEGPGHRATRVLEKVWVDLSGQHLRSHTGNEYIMDIVDDYMSQLWSSPLKNKDDSFPELKAWALARESETSQKIGMYITDQGELKSDKMRDWLKSRGTDQRFTAPYTSAHIGCVERMHCTLMAKAHTMRIYANCPPYLWDEFYLTAAHLHSKTLTRSLKEGITPWEKYHGQKPDYSYMREIGCRVFILIQNKHNPKVYDRSIECILIGYDPNAKTYRCHNKESKKVISSYHVRFLESHDGHSRPLPQTETELSSLNEILQNSTPTPIFSHDEEEDVLPNDLTQLEDPEAIVPNAIPANKPQIRRSSWVAEKSNKPKPTRTEAAVQQSIDAGIRLREARAERKKTLQDIREEEARNAPEVVESAAIAELKGIFGTLNLGDAKGDRVDRALSAISEMPQIDPSTLEFKDEPRTWQEAKLSTDARRWEVGYRDELKSLKDMGVYKLIPRSSVPQGHKVRKGMPIFRIKCDENGKAIRWKVRLVFKGFEQIYGKDYTKTTSPTACMESWRILLHLAAALDWDAQQIDIKTAFLYGLLPEEEYQYMEQPPEFEEPGKEDWVWVIQRGLYGMKQSSRIWNITMNEKMLSWGFTCLSCESCIYYRKSDTGTVICAVHIDDFLSIASNKNENEFFKNQMRDAWTISDLGNVRFVVGIAVNWDRPNRTVILSQSALIDKIVAQFGQKNASPSSLPMDPGLKLRRANYKNMSKNELDEIKKIPYRSLVGCLLYLSIGTCPDITYLVQQLSQYLDCYSYAHWNAAICVVRYLHGTHDLKLHLGGTNPISLLGFTDSDWANCLDTRRSVGGHAYSLGSGVVSWQARKQKTVAASSCEAEYTAAFEASKEGIWLRSLLNSIDHTISIPTTICCDNNAVINLSEDPALHDRIKHIDIKHHFLRKRVQSNEISLSYINTHDNVADIFTKALDTNKFTRFRGFLGLK